MADPRVMTSNIFDRVVSADARRNKAPLFPLPLNLIAWILSYLEKPSDLSRACRTCRLFHYLLLPQLYSQVRLCSYDHTRYDASDNRPQLGLASSFAIGLSAIVSRNVGPYIRSFELGGQWAEVELENGSRIPDGNMLLSSLVRVAIEKMPSLESFRWELNTKMLSTIWPVLAEKNTLRSLSIKFPSIRRARPITVAPPIPSLQSLKITHIDPLCYPDDISYLLLGSKQLRHLALQWSPRMRENREFSVHLASIFGKVEAAGYFLPLKSLAIQNLFTFDCRVCGPIVDTSLIEELTLLGNESGSENGNTIFMSSLPQRSSEAHMTANLKSFRVNRIDQLHCDFIGSLKPIERLYLVQPETDKVATRPSSRLTPPSSSSSTPPKIVGDENHKASMLTTTSMIQSFQSQYIDTIVRIHGRTLQHLLLPPQWRIGADDIARLIRACPSLEQLAVGAQLETFKHLKFLIPFLPRLTTIRFLADEREATSIEAGTDRGEEGKQNLGFLEQMREYDRQGMHEKMIGKDTAGEEWSKLRWIELGAPDLIFELGKYYEVDEDEGDQLNGEVGQGRSGTRWRREVTRRTIDDVKSIDIWKMASNDI